MRRRAGSRALLTGGLALLVLTGCVQQGQHESAVRSTSTPVFGSVVEPHGSQYTALASAVAGFTLYQRPFRADSPVNQPLPASVSFSALTGAKARNLRTAGTTAVNSTAWGVTIVQGRRSDPVVSVEQTLTGTELAKVHMPARTRAPGGSDAAVAVVAPDGRTVYEFYKLARSGSRWTAKYVRTNDLRGTGAEHGARASGTSLLWGIIRQADLREGVIDHTLTLGIPNPALQAGFVPPANAQDGDAATAYTGTIPMGTLFAIPRTADLGGLRLSAEGRMLATALQRYGAYVMRRSDNVSLYAETAADQRRLAPLRADWAKLRDLMQPVKR